MTTRHRPGLAETLETCRPVPQDTPNILKTLLAVQSARGHVPTNAIPQIAQVLGVTEAQVAGVLSIIPTSGLSRLVGTLFECAWENPAWPTTAREFSVPSKIIYA